MATGREVTRDLAIYTDNGGLKGGGMNMSCEFCEEKEVKNYYRHGEEIELEYCNHYKKVSVNLMGGGGLIFNYWDLDFKFCPYCGDCLEEEQ